MVCSPGGGKKLDTTEQLKLSHSWLIYNVVPVSGLWQSDLVIHAFTLFFIFFPIMVCHGMLSIDPCVTH